MLEKMNERAKRLTAVDISLTKMGVLFATIVIVKLFPQLLNINYPVLIILSLACSAKPLYAFWLKK